MGTAAESQSIRRHTRRQLSPWIERFCIDSIHQFVAINQILIDHHSLADFS